MLNFSDVKDLWILSRRETISGFKIVTTYYFNFYTGNEYQNYQITCHWILIFLKGLILGLILHLAIILGKEF